MGKVFGDVRSRVMKACEPSRGNDLEGMAADIDHALEKFGFTRVRVRKTGDPRCLLSASCHWAGTPSEATERMTEAFVKEIRYANPEDTAYQMEGGEDIVRLEFVTAMSRDTIFVTGEIRATFES